MSDPVNPDHYKQGDIECIEAIKASMYPAQFEGYLKGNILKYVWRYEMKKGLQDLLKAQWYMNRLIVEEQSKPEQLQDLQDGF
tara:strand:- start:300 stop:548 length:249 start_codon:yes stop_codon:yes gene_type:complete